MPGLVTATGVLGFLSDEEPELKVFALQTLNDDIDTVWTEVAGALSQMCVVLSPPPPSAVACGTAWIRPDWSLARHSMKMNPSPSAIWLPSCSPRSTTTSRLTTRA